MNKGKNVLYCMYEQYVISKLLKEPDAFKIIKVACEPG